MALPTKKKSGERSPSAPYKDTRQLVAATALARSEIDAQVRPPLNPDRKAKCEFDLCAFGLAYFNDPSFTFFKKPPGEKLKAYIKALEETYLHDARIHVRIPRGCGKTTWVKVATIWAAAYGHRKYMGILAATQDHADAIISDVWKAMERSDTFHEDFTEVTAPIRHLQGRWQRAATQMYKGKLTNITKKAREIELASVEGFPCSGCLIVSCGKGGSIRGRVSASQRPDHVAIDDPQTRETANSPEQTGKIAEWIQGDIGGLQGHDCNLSMVMATTPIAPNDLSETYADRTLHPEWRNVAIPLVESFSSAPDLWEQYFNMRSQDEVFGVQNFATATAFYVENRVAMDDGVVLLDNDLYAKNEVSGVQHAYNLLYTAGKAAFSAEYQMEPVRSEAAFALSPHMVLSRLSGVPIFRVPNGYHTVVGSIDCNQKDALRWMVVAIGPERKCSILAYGRYPDRGELFPNEMPEGQKNALLEQYLHTLVNRIASAQIPSHDGKRMYPVQGVVIDRGFLPGAVQNVAFRSVHAAKLHLAIGYAWNKYAPETAAGKLRPSVLATGNNLFIAQGKLTHYIGVHVDHWREVAQGLFLSTPNMPDSCSLFGSAPDVHGLIARELTAETLLDKGIGVNGVAFWMWKQKPNSTNHYLDVLVYALALASRMGLWRERRLVKADVPSTRQAVVE